MPSWDDGRDLKPADQRRLIQAFNRILAECGHPATTIEELEKFEAQSGDSIIVKRL